MTHFVLAAALALSPLASHQEEPPNIRVACLGDSITEGARLERPERHAWPVQLGHVLGDGYEVRGFGAGGHTLRRGADLPYFRSKSYEEALDWSPAIVLVVLGANDTVSTEGRPNWPAKGDVDWMREAAAIALPFQEAGAHVIVSSPPDFFPDRPGLTAERAADLRARRPRLHELSVKVSSAPPDAPFGTFSFNGALRASDTVDGVHPNPFGHERMALWAEHAVEYALGEPPVLGDADERAEMRERGLELALVDPTVRPRPSAEHRGRAAGWGGGDWFDAYGHLRAAAEKAGPTPVVFLGDSITQGLTGHSDRVTQVDGKRAIDAAFGDVGAISLGLSGDRTEHLLWRIHQGSLDALEPKVIVLQIGVNNLNAAGHTADETARGIRAVTARLRQRFDGAHVVLCGPFTAGKDPKGDLRRRADATHELLGGMDFGDSVTRLDLRPLFQDEAGALRPTMRGDGIHITAEGQRQWMDAIAPIVREHLH